MKENRLLGLIINIVIPVVILVKFTGEGYLGPFYGFIIALSFPIVYGLYDLIKNKNYNFFSIVGVISVALTAGIGLLQLNPKWVAVKEASVPLAIGIAVLLTIKTKFNLVKKLINQIIDMDKVYDKLGSDKIEVFEKKLNLSSYFITGSFFFSAVLNYVLAKLIVVSEPGSVAFNEELGRMTALSFPVIALPSTILVALSIYFLFSNILKLTNLDLEELIRK